MTKILGLVDPQIATLTTERAAKELRIGELEQALRRCQEHVQRHYNANGGWWNDPYVYRLVREIIEPACSPSGTGMVVVERELLERFIAATCAKLPRDRGAYMNALAELRALLKVSS